MRRCKFIIISLFSVFLTACDVESEPDPQVPGDACIRADGYETEGETSLGRPQATISASEPGRLSFSFSADGSDVTSHLLFPSTLSWEQPLVGTQVTLDRFYPGSSAELGLVSGEASFPPDISVSDGDGLVVQIAELSTLTGGSPRFLKRDDCLEDDGAVATDGVLVFNGREAASNDQLDVDVDGRRYRLHVLDAFVVRDELRGHFALFRLPQ